MHQCYRVNSGTDLCVVKVSKLLAHWSSRHFALTPFVYYSMHYNNAMWQYTTITAHRLISAPMLYSQLYCCLFVINVSKPPANWQIHHCTKLRWCITIQVIIQRTISSVADQLKWKCNQSQTLVKLGGFLDESIC